MKQQSTTLVSHPGYSLSKRLLLSVAAMVIAASAPLSLARHQSLVYADVFDSQKSAIEQQITQYQQQASELATQAATLQNQLAIFGIQRNQLQAELAVTQGQYDELTNQIKATEKKISTNQDALGILVRTMYVDGRTTTLEMIASSKNIGDFINRQAYGNAVTTQLRQTIAIVKKSKQKLESDRKKVDTVLAKQKLQTKQLDQTVRQQNQLLADTKGQESTYQELAASSRQQLQSLSEQQRNFYQTLVSSGGASAGVQGSFVYQNWSGNKGCGGGYPYCAPQDTSVDPWALYNRECVSYVAWALVNKYDRKVGRFQGDGNAMDWPSSAVMHSGAVRVSEPQPGDAVILPASGSFAPIGHAMIVDSVNGEWVHVSQFNYYGTGEYSTMDIKTTGVIFLRFPKA